MSALFLFLLCLVQNFLNIFCTFFYNIVTKLTEFLFEFQYNGLSIIPFQKGGYHN